MSLSPNKAWELLQNDLRVVLIDIRATLEYLFVGRGGPHPLDSKPRFLGDSSV